MNFANSISLNFPAIILETLEILKRFKSFMKRFIFPKFHETIQPYPHLRNILIYLLIFTASITVWWPWRLEHVTRGSDSARETQLI